MSIDFETSLLNFSLYGKKSVIAVGAVKTQINIWLLNFHLSQSVTK